MKRSRLSSVGKWRRDFVRRLEGIPIDETVIMRKKTVDGKTTVDIAERKRFLSKSGAKKLMKIVEDTIEEELGR